MINNIDKTQKPYYKVESHYIFIYIFVYTTLGLKGVDMSKRFGRKRLAVDIPSNLHEAIKKIALSRNITLTKYVIRALIRYSLDETKYEDNAILFDRFR